jgi:hypothetical protein
MRTWRLTITTFAMVIVVLCGEAFGKCSGNPRSYLTMGIQGACDAYSGHVYIQNNHTSCTITATVALSLTGGQPQYQTTCLPPRYVDNTLGCAANWSIAGAQYKDCTRQK